MSFLTDIESIVEQLTNTTSITESASKLLTYIITELQTVINSPAPASHAQEVVNALTKHKDELAAAVAAGADDEPEPASVE